MAERIEQRCEECQGTGQVLLLFSWATCRVCEGTGSVVDEDGDTGKFQTLRGRQDTEGSADADRHEGEDDPSYFDDGLEFDDHVGYGAGDVDVWEAED